MKTKWVEAYLDVAERFAMLSSATLLKVGAVVVKDDRIISIGYNGTPSGWDNSCEEQVECNGELKWRTKDDVIHAEQNAIHKLSRCSDGGNGATLFCTHSPCLQCAKLIYGAGISKVYFRNMFKYNEGLVFMSKVGITTVHHPKSHEQT